MKGGAVEVHTILKVFGFTGLYEVLGPMEPHLFQVDQLLKIKTMMGFWALRPRIRCVRCLSLVYFDGLCGKFAEAEGDNRRYVASESPGAARQHEIACS